MQIVRDTKPGMYITLVLHARRDDDDETARLRVSYQTYADPDCTQSNGEHTFEWEEDIDYLGLNNALRRRMMQTTNHREGVAMYLASKLLFGGARPNIEADVEELFGLAD